MEKFKCLIYLQMQHNEQVPSQHYLCVAHLDLGPIELSQQDQILNNLSSFIYIPMFFIFHSGFMLVLGDFAYYVYKIIHNTLIFCTRNILKLVLEFSMHVQSIYDPFLYIKRSNLGRNCHYRPYFTLKSPNSQL